MPYPRLLIVGFTAKKGGNVGVGTALCIHEVIAYTHRSFQTRRVARPDRDKSNPTVVQLNQLGDIISQHSTDECVSSSAIRRESHNSVLLWSIAGSV